MTDSKTNFDKGFYFIPLGGSEQFGMNLNVYVCDGDMIAIDCGIGFADDYYPGIDIMVPDPQFIDDNYKMLKGLIITHAHEDHIGAVARLWDAFDCPVYASSFTAAVLRKKLDEEGVKRAEIIEVEPLDKETIGTFEVEFIPVTHSVPGTYSLRVGTSYGDILHSGDWNLDPAPVIGEATDPTPFKSAGDKGILAYIGDSTNAGVSGRSGSETYVAKGLAEEFKTAKGKIAVTMFSSNISRVKSIVQAAQESGRQVVVIGRSLHRMIGCAIECGYLEGIPDFVNEDDIPLIPDENLVLIVTGSQGESRAALAKIARGAHRSVSFNKGDTVIFSARAIPGNEKGINQVKNNLSASGINIISPKDTKNTIHVSGHPCQDEIADMLQWVRPKTLIPVHGERVQLDDHAQFAKSCQIENVVVPQNGSVIRLDGQEPRIVDHVETGVLAVDERRIITANHASISQRRKLQYTGAIHISLAIGTKGKLIGTPMVDVMGLIDDKDPDDDNFVSDIQKIIKKQIGNTRKSDLKNTEHIQNEIRNGVRRYVSKELGIKPKTTVHLLMV